MNILSLFDGMSCGRIALEHAGIPVTRYYASEIDKYAQIVSQANYPDIIQLGDVTKWREWDIDWSSINLLIGGSPCQGFSFAGKQLAFNDPRSKLFFDYVDILNHIRSLNPDVKFLLENVKMKKESLDIISEYLGVEPVFINSALVSAQNRQRWYWANWEFDQPEDKGIVLADIIESTTAGIVQLLSDNNRIKGVTEDERGFRPNQGDIKKSGISEIGRITKPTGKTDAITTTHSPKVYCGAMRGRYIVDGKRQDHKQLTAGLTTQRLEIRNDGKTNALTTVGKDNHVVYSSTNRIASAIDIKGHDYNKRIYDVNGKSPTLNSGSGGNLEPKILDGDIAYRKLTPIECERLQTVPDNYTNHVSNTQRYRMLGNGWTADVIAHIFMSMK